MLWVTAGLGRSDCIELGCCGYAGGGTQIAGKVLPAEVVHPKTVSRPTGTLGTGTNFAGKRFVTKYGLR